MVRALKHHIFWRSARSKNIFLDSVDSTESTDSIDIIDSIDSILVPHKETANIHTTHKGARAARAHKSTDGGGAFGAAPIGTFVLPLCVV